MTKEGRKQGLNIIELLLALWNALGWKFEGRVIRDGVKFAVLGWIKPRYYSPVFWLHFLAACLFSFKLFLTKRGGENFKIYKRAFIKRDTRNDLPNNRILGRYEEGKAKWLQEMKLFAVIHTRFDEFLLDLSGRIDMDNGGSPTQAFAQLLLEFFLLPSKWLLHELPMYLQYLWEFKVRKSRSLSKVQRSSIYEMMDLGGTLSLIFGIMLIISVCSLFWAFVVKLMFLIL